MVVGIVGSRPHGVRFQAHLVLLLFGSLIVVDQSDVGLLKRQLGGEVAEVVVPADLAQDVLQDHLLLHC